MKSSALILFLLSAGWCFAEGFAYHGALAERNGAAFDFSAWKARPAEERQFTFALYNVAEQGDALWSVTMDSVTPDVQGAFTVNLEEGVDAKGESANFFDVLSANMATTLYIGITIGEGTQELTPRQEILTVPYAAAAEYVEGDAIHFTAKQRIDIEKECQLSSAAIQTLQVSDSLTAQSNLKATSSEMGSLTVTGASVFVEAVSATRVEGYGSIPIGGIMPFVGTEIPKGWAICNGENNTPDLRDYFVVGASESNSNYAVGQTGGAASYTLTIENIPSHTHTLERSIYTHLYDFYRIDDDSNNRWRWTKDRSGYSDSGVGLSSTPEPFSLLPPYVWLVYIMRVE